MENRSGISGSPCSPPRVTLLDRRITGNSTVGRTTCELMEATILHLACTLQSRRLRTVTLGLRRGSAQHKTDELFGQRPGNEVTNCAFQWQCP